MTSPIRLLIVDDHALFRESVGRLLAQEADFTISSVCGTLAEAESVLGQTAVDVVLLDYDLGNALGTELIATIQQQFSHVKVLMLTGGVSAAVVRSSLQAGIAGVLLKHCSPEQLLQAIRQVASGGTWWDPAAMAAPTPTASVTSEISKQQACILRLLLEGLSKKPASRSYSARPAFEPEANSSASPWRVTCEANRGLLFPHPLIADPGR